MAKKKKLETAAKKKKPKSVSKRKNKFVEAESINAIVVAPRLSMCDGKKKRLEKIREQNGIGNI